MTTRDSNYRDKYGKVIPVDLIGARIGLRTVIGHRINSNSPAWWGNHEYFCECECGRQAWVGRHYLLSGQRQSCRYCARKCNQDARRYGIAEIPLRVFHFSRDRLNPPLS